MRSETRIMATTAGEIRKGDWIVVNGWHMHVANVWSNFGNQTHIEDDNGDITVRPSDGLVYREVAR